MMNTSAIDRFTTPSTYQSHPYLPSSAGATGLGPSRAEDYRGPDGASDRAPLVLITLPDMSVVETSLPTHMAIVRRLAKQSRYNKSLAAVILGGTATILLIALLRGDVDTSAPRPSEAPAWQPPAVVQPQLGVEANTPSLPVPTAIAAPAGHSALPSEPYGSSAARSPESAPSQSFPGSNAASAVNAAGMAPRSTRVDVSPPSAAANQQSSLSRYREDRLADRPRWDDARTSDDADRPGSATLEGIRTQYEGQP